MRLMRLGLGVAVLALSACSNTSQVRPIGPDTYVVSYEQGGKITSWNSIKGHTYDAANTYCANQGKQMQEVTTETHGARGWTRVEAELTFKCIPRQ